jgi:hypothetical protein
MTHAFNSEAWHDLFLMLGGAVAALTGLLFVAISIRLSEIAKEPRWRLRAFTNIMTLTGLLIEAALFLIPQASVALGAEILAGNLLFLIMVPGQLFFHRAWLHTSVPRIRIAYGTLSFILGAAGGASLIVEIGSGIYLVVASYLSLVLLCVWNAWSLMADPVVDIVP